jgi:hypothetical protein
VLAVDSSAMTLDAASDGEIVVEGRPWSYALEQGFAAQAGDSVRLAGFYEDGEFKVGQVENLSTGLGVVLRGESGRPGWAGNGNRQGQQGQRGS